MKYFNKINIWVFLAFFYIIFTFSFKNISTIHNIAIYAVCGIYILWNYKYLLKYMNIIFKTCLKYSVLMLIICTIATIIIPSLYKTYDYSYIDIFGSILRTSIKLIAVLILFEKVHKKDADEKLFSKYIILSTCIYIGTTIIFVMFPGLKVIWNNIIQDPSYHILVENSNYMTRYGIMGYSGFQVAFKVVFAIIINGYLILEEKCKVNKNNFMLYITYVILILGSLFYGRIGFVITLIITSILMILFIGYNKKASAFLFIGIIVIILICVGLYNCNDKIKLWMNWAFAPIINFINTGELYTGSSDIVFEKMIFMPEIKTLLFGDGYYTDIDGSGYYKSTDVGFMRPILYYGLFFTIIGYLSILIPIISLIIESIKEKRISKIFMSISFLIALVIIEIKGEIFYRFLPLIAMYVILFEMRKIKGKEMNIKEILKKIIPYEFIMILPNIKSYLKGYNKNKDKFKESMNSKRIIYIGSPKHGNLGDQAIAVATLKMLKDNFNDYIIIDIPVEEFVENIRCLKKYKNEKDIILLQGGGNFGNEYMTDERCRILSIKMFRNNKIVMMPQTIYFTDDEYGKMELKKAQKVCNKHQNLYMFAREEQSYKIMKELFNCKVDLVPDIVLYLNKEIENDKRQGIITCFRNDLEKNLNGEQEKEIYNLLKNYTSKIDRTDTAIKNIIIEKEERDSILENKLEEFRKHKLVITDRLHGMIFAAITGTPCIALENYNYKVSGVYQWIKDLNYIKLINKKMDLKELKEDIDILYNMKETTYSNNELKKQYMKIVNTIKEK